MASNFSQVFFNKSLSDLVYQDIVDFFVDVKEESTRSEFKSYAGDQGGFNQRIDGVIRAICAMLNSEGGIVIWGAPMGVTAQGQNVRTFHGALSPVSELKTKDWIINKVSDLINPMPVGVDVAILHHGVEAVYVFEVQRSDYSPHQFRNIYYARLDGQTKPAPHYLIEALFRKIRIPQIEAFLNLNLITQAGGQYLLDIEFFIFNFTALQNEEDLTIRLMCPQGLFVQQDFGIPGHTYGYEGHMMIFKNIVDYLSFGAPTHHSERLVFDIGAPNLNQVDLLLSFQGKHTPFKASNYKLNLEAVNWNTPDQLGHIFTSVEENILSSDKQAALGNTRESTLSVFLKR